MSKIANYTFIPWLRQGLANHISGQTGIRATIGIDIKWKGVKVGGGTETLPDIHQDIEIYGPCDIEGQEQSAIIKVEPHNWITNFEPNYLPYIEFYDEDLPWRYSPKTPAGHRLHPWIMLIVLKEDEFDDGKNIKDRPLPYIKPDNAAPLPPPDQLWAWAHIHVNKNIIGTDFTTNNAGNVESKLDAVLKSDPDLAYSRILCPRKLEPNVAYHAFLVPVFETGMLAGLGKDPSTAASFDAYAWSDAAIPAELELPYYYRWYFKTGTVGDFEYLVRLLEPKPVDSRVGLRGMDVQTPGANIRGIIDALDATDDQKLESILKLGGALRIPDRFYTPEEFEIVEKYRKWATLNDTAAYPHPFQADLAAFINLTDSYAETDAAQANAESDIHEVKKADYPETKYDIKRNPDPLITAPLYGRWHALTQRLLKERDDTDIDPNDNWVHDLNLDPRWRVSAGFGTAVVQDNQEDYMKAAWEQVGDVLEANKKIKQGQLAKEVAWVWHQKHIKPIQEKYTAKWLNVSAPLHSRVLNQGLTVSHQVNQSKVPAVIFSSQMRKMLKPRGKLAKRLELQSPATMDAMLGNINSGVLSAAPPRVLPQISTVKDIADAAKPDDSPELLVDLLNTYPWLRWLPLLLGLYILLLLFLFSPSVISIAAWTVIASGLIAAFAYVMNVSKKIDIANMVLEENQTPESVDEMPQSPDFRISTPQEDFRPTIGGGADSAEATRFKMALRDTNCTLQQSVILCAKPVRPRLKLAETSNVMFAALNPQVTIPNWVWGSVLIPGRIKDQLEEDFVEAMAYPEFDYPMYKPLVKRSSELFLPNINFVSENSISLLETNQKFIESYMVGLNHEFARELLWREYPTDQRGSYFRQFWDASGYHDTGNLTAEELKEKLRDIPPIHTWMKGSDLGKHDHREERGKSEEEVVLVIRGELLKKYPNAIIYAHKAVWRDEDKKPILDINSGQMIDLTQERDLRPLTDAEEKNPPRTIVKTPLYEAKVDPDIYFFGFDLTVCEAKGGTGSEDDLVDPRCADKGVKWSDAGWFFVIKERSGEIRMGLDVPQDDDALKDVKVWNDLSWNHVTPAVSNGDYLKINNETKDIPLEPLDLSKEAEKEEQRGEDLKISWNKNMSSADLAYILYQVPVMVAVHGSEMLPRN